MLKDKNLLENFNLVEELEDQIAEAINGGVTILNNTRATRTFWWIDPTSTSFNKVNLEPNKKIKLPEKEGLYFVWDLNTRFGWEDVNKSPQEWDLTGEGGFAPDAALQFAEFITYAGPVIISLFPEGPVPIG